MNRKRFVATFTVLLVVVAGAVAFYFHRAPTETVVKIDSSKTASKEAIIPNTGLSSSSSSIVETSSIAPLLRNLSWGEKFRQADDYFTFVSNAALVAYNGDGRAAYYIDQALATCGYIPSLVKSSQNQDEAYKKYIDEFSQTPYMPQWAKDREIARFHKCAKLGSENPFSSLPDRDGGYPYKYWKELALNDKDPLVEATELSNVAMSIDTLKTDDAKQEAVGKINNYIHDAILSKDPEAIFTAGQALLNVNTSKDPVRGIAVQLAACDLGYDCSANNASLFQSNCKYTHLCPENQSYSEVLQQSVSAEQYSEAYAQAQIFKEMLKRGDTDGLEKFIRLNGRYSTSP